MHRRQRLKLSRSPVLALWCALAGSIIWLASPGFPSSLWSAAQSIPLVERVLVVYNQSVSESLEVANYYIRKRGIPAGNLCAVNSTEIRYISDWNIFDSVIKAPIRNCLNAVGRDKILYIVFTYHTPYKAGTPARTVDQQIADIWDELSTGRNSDGRHPYFAAAQSQGNIYQPYISLADYRQQPAALRLYSVWRLDAPTAALAKGLIDKALQAEASGLSGRGCFDRNRDDINEVEDYNFGSGDWDIHRSAEFARQAGFPVVEDNHYEEFGTAPAPLRCDDTALYAGWYSLNNYNDAFTWKPGAIGFHIDSLSAYDLRTGTNWTVNAIIKGIAVTSGAIDEPYLSGVAHADGVFRNLFEGANVGDALLRNTEYLKWMIVNIGDPLYRPFTGGRAPFNFAQGAQTSLFLNPVRIGGGGQSSATVTISNPAPAGGTLITLTSSNTAIAQTPPSVTIPQGAAVASFNINTSAVTIEQYAKITASFPGGAISNTLIVKPNSAPTVRLTSPANNQTFTAPANINITSEASDNDGQISRVDFYEGSTLIGSDTISPYNITWNNVSVGNYTLTAKATDSAGGSATSSAINIIVKPAPPPANPPVLLAEENSGMAVALESASWLRDPLALVASYNLSADGRTRVMLFALNAELRAGENFSAVTAQAEDAQQKIYTLAVEYVGRVHLFDWLTQVIVKLPDDVGSAAELRVSISLRGFVSNKVRIRIKPSGASP